LNPSSVKESAADPIDELAAVLEISGEEENVFEKPTAAQNKDPFDLKKALEDAKKTGTEAAQQNKNDLEDNSGALTRRLVTALSQEEVLSVISEAFKNLGAVRMAAATGEGKEAKKAFAIIKRLNKLIARAQRKMKDLGEEAAMLLKHQRAEKKKQELLAKQIRAELERHIRERKNREKTYLRDTAPLREEDYMTPGLEPMSRAELEAKVMALAQSMAQIYSPSAAGVPAVAGGEAAAADGAAVSDSGGGDASAPAEGGGGGEVAAE
jgi:ribosomal protein L14